MFFLASFWIKGVTPAILLFDAPIRWETTSPRRGDMFIDQREKILWLWALSLLKFSFSNWLFFVQAPGRAAPSRKPTKHWRLRRRDRRGCSL